MLYLCDNQALLKAAKGEGGKATLVRAPDANILLEAIEQLRKGTTAGAATLLGKHINQNMRTKKPTFKRTRRFLAKMFPRNGTTGQIELERSLEKDAK